MQIFPCYFPHLFCLFKEHTGLFFSGVLVTSNCLSPSFPFQDTTAEQTSMDVLSEEPKPETCDMPCQMQLAVESAQLSSMVRSNADIFKTFVINIVNSLCTHQMLCLVFGSGDVSGTITEWTHCSRGFHWGLDTHFTAWKTFFLSL